MVVKSNALIEAMLDMGLQEMRFLAFAAAQLPHDAQPEPGKPYDMEIDVHALATAFEIDQKNAYQIVRDLGDSLIRKIINFQDGQRDIAVGLITKRVYHTGEGRLWFRFDEDLLPHLMGLTERFTTYRIKDVYQFSRPHTWRVYELLKQYKEIGTRTIALDEFRMMLGLLDKYPRVVDMKKRVLDPALEEINATSDIRAQYTQQKRGRRVMGFVFHIKPNTTPQDRMKASADAHHAKTPPVAPGLAKALREECRMNPRQARQLADLAAMHGKVDEIHAKIPALKRRYDALDNPTTNLGGYCFRALAGDMEQLTLFDPNK